MRLKLELAKTPGAANKGQFYLIAVISIAIVILPILVSKYIVNYTRIEETPQYVRTNINSVLGSLDIRVNLSEQRLLLKNKDVLLALGTSGGLGVNMEDVINSSKVFLDCSNETDRVSLYKFPYCPSKTGACNCNASQLTGYLYLTEENKAYMKTFINGFEKFGKSPIGRAVEDSKTIITNQASPSRNRIAILLATGPDNCGNDPCTAAEGFPYGVPVYTIGFKVGASGEDQLKCISEKTGGEYFYAETGQDLKDIFCKLGRGTETEISDFLSFIKRSISERLLNISFDAYYTTSLSARMSSAAGINVNYTAWDESRSLNGSFYYSIYENSSLVSSGMEPISVSRGETYEKMLSIPKRAGSNYTSVAYIEAGGERTITNELTLPYYSAFKTLTAKNIQVSYNVSTDGTFVTDKVDVHVYITEG